MILFLSSITSLAVALLISWVASGIVRPIVLIPGFLTLQLSKNPGIAFSINIPSPWEEILILSALGAVCVMAIRSTSHRFGSIAFGLIIGGAIANLIDRFPDGLVTDYVAIGTFPVFNAADTCITIGAIFLLLEAYVQRPQKP